MDISSTLYHYRAIVTRCYDGDTCTVDIDLGLDVWIRNQTVRLYGIDTPEVRGPERPEGIIARDALRELIDGKEVVIETIQDTTGKYGRWLAIIWLDGVSINEHLVSEGLAENYPKAEVTSPPAETVSPPATFFDSIRSSLFNGRLSQEQVSGTMRIYRLCELAQLHRPATAYVLATVFHETGRAMQPREENLNYSVSGLLRTFGRHRISRADAERYGRAAGRPADRESIANIIYGGAWGRDNLGNTEPGDGWRFRGRADVQQTGRRNYAFIGEKTGQDLLRNPDAVLRDAWLSGYILVAGMMYGWFTGKSLGDYRLPEQFREARQIVNRMDKADEISGYARKFMEALAPVTA